MKQCREIQQQNILTHIRALSVTCGLCLFETIAMNKEVSCKMILFQHLYGLVNTSNLLHFKLLYLVYCGSCFSSQMRMKLFLFIICGSLLFWLLCFCDIKRKRHRINFPGASAIYLPIFPLVLLENYLVEFFIIIYDMQYVIICKFLTSFFLHFKPIMVLILIPSSWLTLT